MPAQLSTKAIDQSTYLVTASSFTDEASASVTPSAVTWTLKNIDGDVVNSRLDVAATPGSSVQILLSGDDLKLSDGKTRTLTLTYTYNSSLGTGLTGIETVHFGIELTPYTYDPDTAVGQVRELIGDTDFAANSGVKPPDCDNFTDVQITNALGRVGNDVRLAAAGLCEALAMMWLAHGQIVTVGRYQIDPTPKAQHYRELAKQLRGQRFAFYVSDANG